MRRFTIPKAWLDRIVIAGKTCSSSEAGAKGVFIASSRGGLYAPGTPQQSNDFQEIYLRAILALHRHQGSAQSTDAGPLAA